MLERQQKRQNCGPRGQSPAGYGARYAEWWGELLTLGLADHYFAASSSLSASREKLMAQLRYVSARSANLVPYFEVVARILYLRGTFIVPFCRDNELERNIDIVESR